MALVVKLLPIGQRTCADDTRVTETKTDELSISRKQLRMA